MEFYEQSVYVLAVFGDSFSILKQYRRERERICGRYLGEAKQNGKKDG